MPPLFCWCLDLRFSGQKEPNSKDCLLISSSIKWFVYLCTIIGLFLILKFFPDDQEVWIIFGSKPFHKGLRKLSQHICLCLTNPGLKQEWNSIWWKTTYPLTGSLLYSSPNSVCSFGALWPFWLLGVPSLELGLFWQTWPSLLEQLLLLSVCLSSWDLKQIFVKYSTCNCDVRSSLC